MFINYLWSFLSNIYFIFEILWIVSVTYLDFLYDKNYPLFIQNITRRLASKNILYVKFFQAISLNNNLIDGAMNQELIKYTDSVPYCSDDVDWEIITNLKAVYGIDFLSNTTPINAGMISLVYKMNDGIENQEVVVKIKRVGIEDKLNDAIDKMKFMIYLLSFIPQLNHFNLLDSFNKNILILKNQLDFEQEVQNTMRMKDDCKNLKYIKIPKVYESVTKLFPNVIVMEYISGVHISKLEESDYEPFAKLVVKYGVVSSFMNGFGHGDLHAGNILFIKNGDNYKLGLIDFGIVLKIHEDVRDKFMGIFYDFFNKPPLEISNDFLSCFVEPKKVFQKLPKEHKETLVQMTEKIIENVIHGSKTANQSKLFEFIIHFNDYLSHNDLKKHGLYFNDDFIKMQMGLAMAQGVCLCLCKNNYIEIANQVSNEMFHNDIFFEPQL
jgi:predicted unusual protein kinase regulating ubiquinone biosynthesis (AarF/ABC1/UbiB family)